MIKKKKKNSWFEEVVLGLGLVLITVGLGMEISEKKAVVPTGVEMVKGEGQSLGVISEKVPGKISLNSATKAELESLPGIGPILAGRIIEYRKSGQGFKRIEEVQLIKGLSKKVYDQIKDKVGL